MSTNNIDILLYNSKDEVITAYTSNNPNYQNGEAITIKESNKNYKVVDINKYRIMGLSERIALELKVVK